MVFDPHTEATFASQVPGSPDPPAPATPPLRATNYLSDDGSRSSQGLTSSMAHLSDDGSRSLPGRGSSFGPGASEGEDKVRGQMSYGGSDPGSDAERDESTRSDRTRVPGSPDSRVSLIPPPPATPPLRASTSHLSGDMRAQEEDNGSGGAKGDGSNYGPTLATDGTPTDPGSEAPIYGRKESEAPIGGMKGSENDRGSTNSFDMDTTSDMHSISVNSNEKLGSASSFFSEAMIDHFEKFWPYYLAFLICLIIVSFMVCYRKELRAFWRSMMGKKSQSVPQSAQEQNPKVPQDPPMGLDIV